MLKYQRLICILSGIGLLFLIGCVQREAEHPSRESEMEERDGMAKAMEQEFQMTVDPSLGYVPKERLFKAQRQLDQIAMNSPNGLEALSWQERGPNNVAGRTRTLIIDKNDATGNTVIAASVSGGIWKTTNFKSAQPTWTAVAERMGNIAVSALAQDPSNPSIIYAGTGEGWLNVDAVSGNGIWKSVDGGNNWSQIPFTDSLQTSHNFDFIQDMVVTNQGVLYVSARGVSIYGFGNAPFYCNLGGILRTADGGATWSRVIGKLTQANNCDSAYNFIGADLELAANGDVYATTGIENGGITDQGRIFRTTAASNGASWTEITPSGTWGRIDMACAPSDPSRLYALMQLGSGNGIGGIRRSSDFGATWDSLPLPSWCYLGTTSADFTNGQAWYDLIVAVDPTNANNVYIGGVDLFKSTNGGNNWSQLTRWYSYNTDCGNLPAIHADQHNIIFFPNSGSEFIATNDGGIYYTSNGGTSWAVGTKAFAGRPTVTYTYSLKNIGYNVTQLYACAIHPTQPNYMLAGAQDNGTQQFTSAGINSTTEVSFGGDGAFCHIDQTDGNIQIASYVYNQFFYSKNNGQTWSQYNPNTEGRFINPSDYDNANKYLYTAYQAGQLGQANFSGTGAPTFTNSTIAPIAGQQITAIKVDPTVSGGGTIWIAATSNTSIPTIVKVTGANTTSPTVVSSFTFTNLLAKRAYISSIDVDPANAAHLLTTISNYGVKSVWESTDAGASWTALDNTLNLPDVPVRWGVFLPSTLSVNGTTGGGILIATEVGVYYASQSAGVNTTWTLQASGLPNVRVDMLKFRESDGLLAAATHGRGLFTANMTKLTTGISTVPLTQNFIRYTTSATDQLNIYIGNLNVQKMNVEIIDMMGRLVYKSGSNYQNTSIYTGNLSKGYYLLRITGNKNEYYAQQFLK